MPQRRRAIQAGTVALLAVGFVAACTGPDPFGGLLPALVYYAGMLGFVAMPLAFLAVIGAIAYSAQRPHAGAAPGATLGSGCRACGYDLAGLPVDHGICPECGRSYDICSDRSDVDGTPG
ncbi:MAG: hypothetical protein AAFR38_12555 [Planctomycetota bacterium]